MSIRWPQAGPHWNVCLICGRPFKSNRAEQDCGRQDAQHVNARRKGKR